MNDRPASDSALSRMIEETPILRFLGVEFERRGDELTAILRYHKDLIGNPFLPALHGGAIGAFLEATALTELALAAYGAEGKGQGGSLSPMPRTIDITFDYLRSGKPQDCYARAFILRRGRRVANLRIEAWQESRDKPIASAHGNFLMPGLVASAPAQKS